ncbi:MAG TPA: helix-turn-helix domain-containing protein [Anaerovoracaceae bacterium]|nr:helix-turn-helix domain-containing protein [Anaerovoracaceae bacterium]
MISTNLQTLRKLNKYTQEEVAEKIGVSRQAVAKWENGESLPDIGNCMALAELYDVTLDNLVSGGEGSVAPIIPPKGKHIFGTATVGERGQIVIPKKAREIFGFNPGDSLMILGDESLGGIAMLKAELFLRSIEPLVSAIPRPAPNGGKTEDE